MTRLICRTGRVSSLVASGDPRIMDTHVAADGERNEAVKVVCRDRDRDSLVAKERTAVACTYACVSCEGPLTPSHLE